jgi:hypothetical protein
VVNVEDLQSEVPETPQAQIPLISPPPIQRNHQATYKERLGIHTLRHVAGFTLGRISAMVRKPISTISYIARQPTTPPRRRTTMILDTPARRELALFVQSDPAHRRMSLGELSHAMGYTCSESTVRRALAMENLFRYIAKSQPFITEMNRVCRINYVDAGLALPYFHWQNVAWTDEGHSHLGGHENAFVTRHPGPDRFLEACQVPSFKKSKISVMYWIGFTARSKCKIIFWEKSWGTIRSVSYLEHIVPVLRDWLEHEELTTGQPHWIVQDNAPAHAAKATKEQMATMGMRLMNHPASSPDLNLAENPIGQLKYNIMNRRSRRPTSLAQLRAALEFEWNTYPQEKLAHLVERFPRRLLAVKAANGGPTRY